MPAAGDLVQFNLGFESTLFRMQMISSFTYLVLDTSDPFNFASDGQTLSDNWMNDVGPIWQPCFSADMYMVHAEWQLLPRGLDFWQGDLTTPMGGGVSGDYLPPFVTWAFRYNRRTRVSRNGAKRFPGVVESTVTNGNPTSGQQTNLDALADKLGQTLALEADSITHNVAVLEPVIPHYVRLTDTWTFNEVQSVTFQRLSTQNTRKIGRGS